MLIKILQKYEDFQLLSELMQNMLGFIENIRDWIQTMKLRLTPSRCTYLMRLSCVIGSLLFIICLPRCAFSQKSPLKLPFQINVSITGKYDKFTESSDTTTPPTHDTITSKVEQIFVIDPSAMGSTLVLAGDSLTYFDSNSYIEGWSSSHAILHFDTLRKGITSMSIASNENYVDYFGVSNTFHYSWGLSCLNVPYDNDSIPTLDSIKSSDLLGLYYDSSGIDISDVGPPVVPLPWDSASSKLVSGQLQLSGSNIPVSRVNESPSAIGFEAIQQNGQLECTFAPSNHQGILEVFSTIGEEIERISILPSQNIIVIPHLTVGLYFLRLENNFLRVYIPE